MKKAISGFHFIGIVVVFITTFLTCSHAMAQKESKAIKIGIYDSRIVVMAYSRSDLFKEYLEVSRVKNDSALKANDTEKITELAIQGMSYQHLLHQMVFGTGTITPVISLVKDQVLKVAQKAGVVLVISKFELTYQDPSLEIVDLTSEISQLFKPEGDFVNIATEIEKVTPVPLPDLTIEKEMLDGYCNRYWKK